MGNMNNIYGRSEEERIKDDLWAMNLTPTEIAKMSYQKTDENTKWETFGICDLCKVEVKSEYLSEVSVDGILGSVLACPKCRAKLSKEANNEICMGKEGRF